MAPPRRKKQPATSLTADQEPTVVQVPPIKPKRGRANTTTVSTKPTKKMRTNNKDGTNILPQTAVIPGEPVSEQDTTVAVLELDDKILPPAAARPYNTRHPDFRPGVQANLAPRTMAERNASARAKEAEKEDKANEKAAGKQAELDSQELGAGLLASEFLRQASEELEEATPKQPRRLPPASTDGDNELLEERESESELWEPEVEKVYFTSFTVLENLMMTCSEAKGQDCRAASRGGDKQDHERYRKCSSKTTAKR